MNKEQTIAEQLKITKFPFIIKDDSGNTIYYEDNDKSWRKYEYNDKRNDIYYENSSGYWIKTEYNSKGTVIYYENSDGIILNNRPKAVPEYTMEQLITKLGHDFKIKK